MSENADLIKLYSKRILQLAAEIPMTEPLENPDASAKHRSPLCGSTVSVALSLDGDRVSAFSQDVKACALGQASASVLGANIIGTSVSEIIAARDALTNLLKNDGPVPSDPFGDLEVLSSAKDYKNRHASILLSFNAAVEAIEIAQKKAALS